ncbi:MAG: acyl-CoA dehydrogenase family protein [Acidimicrobiales bacterium]
MYFGFSDDQLAFRDAVRDLLRDACPPEAVRRAWDDDTPGFDPKLWAGLGAMGVLGMLAPTDAGGLGLSELDLVLVLEESGRAAFPGPLVEHAAVGVPALVGTEFIAPAVNGELVVGFGDRADRVGWGATADAIVVASGEDLVLVERSEVSVVRSVVSVDRSRRDSAVVWEGGRVLNGDAGLARDRAALGSAAQLCGLAARLVDMTVEYAKVRHQFGVPIGSYQAIKHHLANAALRLEHARPAVYRAAYSVAHDAPTRGRDVSMAKVMASDAAALAGRVALQCHGAIGYTWEHDLHLWLKRVWALERAYGTTAHHRERVACAVIGAPDAQELS